MSVRSAGAPGRVRTWVPTALPTPTRVSSSSSSPKVLKRNKPEQNWRQARGTWLCEHGLQLYPREIPSQELVCKTSAEMFPCPDFLRSSIKAASSLRSSPAHLPSPKKRPGGLSSAHSKGKPPAPAPGEASWGLPRGILGDQPPRLIFLSQ